MLTCRRLGPKLSKPFTEKPCIADCYCNSYTCHYIGSAATNNHIGSGAAGKHTDCLLSVAERPTITLQAEPHLPSLAGSAFPSASCLPGPHPALSETRQIRSEKVRYGRILRFMQGFAIASQSHHNRITVASQSHHSRIMYFTALGARSKGATLGIYIQAFCTKPPRAKYCKIHDATVMRL